MASQVFESLRDLVKEVTEDGDETAFCGTYRNKDYYVLAQSDEAALSAIAESIGVTLGYVPLSTLIKATKEALRSPDKDEGKPQAENVRPADVDLAGATLPQIRKVAEDLGIPTKDIPRAELLKKIEAARQVASSPGQKTLPV